MQEPILTIAGSDTLGGGGLQADLKTFEDHQLFGLTAITCVATMQDGKFTIADMPASLLAAQLESLSENTDLRGIKLGLLHSIEAIHLVRDFLRSYSVPVVLDPVLAFKETEATYQRSYREALVKELFPFAAIVTPNLAEAELLSGVTIIDIPTMKQAAEIILSYGPKTVVIKGGQRLAGRIAYDLFYDGRDFQLLEKPKLAATTINGAGCTFASAIAAELVRGNDLLRAVELGKAFVYQSIQHGIILKNGDGNVWPQGRNAIKEGGNSYVSKT